MQVNLLEYFESGAAKVYSERIAIVEAERSYTFAEVGQNSKRLATALIAAADIVNHPIAVFLGKGATTVFANLGILYSGNFYTNLDVKSPSQRIRNILNNINPAFVITSTELLPALMELGVERSKVLVIDEVLASKPRYDDAALIARLDRVIDTDPLCIINTSGSTGIPKGVAISHRSTIEFMDWVFANFEFGPETRIGSLSPFYFDIYTLELVACIAKGATLVLIPDQLAIFPVKLVEFLTTQRITFLFWVPSIMVNISNQNLLEKFDLHELKTVFFAGEVFPMKHLNAWRKALPWTKFVNLYGPIEITVDCTYFVLDREFRDDEALPIGLPCRNTDVLILNEANQPCNGSEIGELCVRGSSLALGYWNDPEKTAKAFVQNPLNKHYPETIYRTGDLVYRNERGEIVFVGRKDFQIKHMGYRIELPEIENQVLAIEGVANACVLYNKGKKEITLFYEAKDQLTPAHIRQQLGNIFPKYMLPTAFHCLPELPRNPNGKIDRNGLASQLEASS
jgi:D-alanine--poly(phosphoribitol) ligase subunit 1